MQIKLRAVTLLNAIMGVVVFIIGLSFLLLVHPVPGLVFIGGSLLYLPQTNNFFQKHLGFSIPQGLKIFLALFILWFTLGVSDLGDIIDYYIM